MVHLYAGCSADKPKEEATTLPPSFTVCLNFKLTLTPKTCGRGCPSIWPLSGFGFQRAGTTANRSTTHAITARLD